MSIDKFKKEDRIIDRGFWIGVLIVIGFLIVGIILEMYGRMQNV